MSNASERLVLVTDAGPPAFAPLETVTEAISPGPIDTAINEKSGMPAAMTERFAKLGTTIPLQRKGRSEEIAAAVAFLAFGATYTTGAELPVDGGWSRTC